MRVLLIKTIFKIKQKLASPQMLMFFDILDFKKFFLW
jgi:hypothetical protein